MSWSLITAHKILKVKTTKEELKHTTFTHMWNIKQKVMNEQWHKNKVIDTDNRMVIPKGKRRWQEGKLGKGIKYMKTEGNYTLGAEHAKQYTDVEL